MNKSFEAGILKEVLEFQEDPNKRLGTYKSGAFWLNGVLMLLCLFAPIAVLTFGASPLVVAALTIPAGIMLGVSIMIGKDIKRLQVVPVYTTIDIESVKRRLAELEHTRSA